MNSYYLVQIYATVVWINTKVAWNHTIKLWNLGSKMFPKNSVRHWMMECETFFSISALLALLLIKTSENYFLSGPTRYEFILHWYEFIPAWYIFMLRGLFWHTDRVFCCSTLKPAPISVKVAVKIIIIMHQFRLKFYCSTLKSAPIYVKVSVILMIRSWGIGLQKYWRPLTTGRLLQIMLKFYCFSLKSVPISVKASMMIIIRSWS